MLWYLHLANTQPLPATLYTQCSQPPSRGASYLWTVNYSKAIDWMRHVMSVSYTVSKRKVKKQILLYKYDIIAM